jgi:hypothetical protein
VAEETASEGPVQGGAALYLDYLKDAEQAQRQYHALCDTVDDLYANMEKLAATSADREYQLFWANMEVTRPSVYSRVPVPVVGERFRDRNDLLRRAAELLERALVSDIEADDLHETLRQVRDDLCVNSRGVSRIRIVSRWDIDMPSAEHIDRKDFRHEPARKWTEVGWVGFRGWYSKAEATKRFTSAGGDANLPDTLPLGMKFQKVEIGDYKGERKCGVWEMWHKGNQKVCFVTEGVETLLDERDPWMDLEGFFPCPRPAYGTLQRATLTPVPDLVYYRDQLEEINALTARVSGLTEALRMRGFYAAGIDDVASAIEKALRDTDDRAMLVPVSSMAALGVASLKDAIIWMPIAEVAQTVQVCLEQRRVLIDDVYQISGLSDIMRGAPDPDETLGAQQLKSQYGSMRVRERQAEMVRIARDLIRMKAEVFAETVPMEALMKMAMVDDLPSAQDIEMQKQQVMQQAQQALMGMVQQAVQAMQAPPMPPEGAMPPQGAPAAPQGMPM